MRSIDADALKKDFELGHELGDMIYVGRVLDIIDNAPTVEAFTKEDMAGAYNEGYACGSRENKRPQGEWIKHIDDLFPEESTEECPFCHEEQRLVGNDDNFCPNCGAKLKMPY